MVIKFRAKAITGEWVYGNFIHDKRFKGMSNEFRIHDQDTGMESDVLEDSIGMYIGKKDPNGFEIYTGDKVYRHETDCSGRMFMATHVVIYNELNFEFCLLCLQSAIFAEGALSHIQDGVDLKLKR
jgi:hypothetical protein